MIKRVFVDSDIILDVALAREPFLGASKLVLATLENGKALGFISANSVGNLYYILRKSSDDAKARFFLTSITKYLTVVPTSHSTILNALHSEFTDFEDAIQNQTAIDGQSDCLITRNIDDYKKSDLEILLPLEFMALYE